MKTLIYINTIKTNYGNGHIIKHKKILKPCNNKYSIVKKLNNKLKDFILTYTEHCIKETDIIVKLYIHTKRKCLQLYFSTVISNSLKAHIDVDKSIIVKVENDDDFNTLKEIAIYLSNEENNNSLFKNLNNLITTDIELIDYNMEIMTETMINSTDGDLIIYSDYRISINN